MYHAFLIGACLNLTVGGTVAMRKQIASILLVGLSVLSLPAAIWWVIRQQDPHGTAAADAQHRADAAPTPVPA